jgi:predicted sulfurtransferase
VKKKITSQGRAIPYFGTQNNNKTGARYAGPCFVFDLTMQTWHIQDYHTHNNEYNYDSPGDLDFFLVLWIE